MIRKRRAGFTLIEVLMVTLILSILAAIATPRFDFTGKRGYRTALRSDLRNLLAQQELYRVNSYVYAPSLYAVGFNGSEGSEIEITEASPAGWAATGVHAGLPGVRCGVFYGDASPSNADPALQPGVVKCSE